MKLIFKIVSLLLLRLKDLSFLLVVFDLVALLAMFYCKPLYFSYKTYNLRV